MSDAEVSSTVEAMPVHSLAMENREKQEKTDDVALKKLSALVTISDNLEGLRPDVLERASQPSGTQVSDAQAQATPVMMHARDKEAPPAAGDAQIAQAQRPIEVLPILQMELDAEAAAIIQSPPKASDSQSTSHQDL